MDNLEQAVVRASTGPLRRRGKLKGEGMLLIEKPSKQHANVDMLLRSKLNFRVRKKKKLSEALINPVTEYQNGLLMLPRKNDRERGDKTVSLFISESGQAGASSGTH